MEIKLRWIKKSDLGYFKEICSAEGSDLIDSQIRKANVSCLVADMDGKVCGFVFYEMRKNKIKINYLMVDTAFRRKGVGSSLLSGLISKLNEKRSQICFAVSEYHLDVQLFLKNLGFKATEIVKGRDDQCDYNFLYELKGMIVA